MESGIVSYVPEERVAHRTKRLKARKAQKRNKMLARRRRK